MGDERQEFSKRLAEAMRSRGHDPRPGVLMKLFNARYRGRSIAFSTASKWLHGKTLPVQDKLRVLADLLRVDPQYLRFGGKLKVSEPGAADVLALVPQDRAMIETYLALAPAQRRLVRELVAALDGVSGTA